MPAVHKLSAILLATTMLSTSPAYADNGDWRDTLINSWTSLMERWADLMEEMQAIVKQLASEQQQPTEPKPKPTETAKNEKQDKTDTTSGRTFDTQEKDKSKTDEAKKSDESTDEKQTAGDQKTGAEDKGDTEKADQTTGKQNKAEKTTKPKDRQPPDRKERIPPVGTLMPPAGSDDFVGGRGGNVIQVTNLNDSGTGSLRACVEADGPRTCVFRVAGTITLQTPIDIQNPNITIAGQTAPGGGILLRGTELPGSWDGDSSGVIIIRARDVKIQFLRIREGSGNFGSQEGRTVYLRGNDGNNKNIMLDHNSISWASDENVTVWGPNANILISNNLIGEGLMPHSMGLVVGANGNEGRGITGVDITKNFFIDNAGRNPFVLGAEQTVTDNLVYNWGYSRVEIRGGAEAVITGNVFKPGPDSHDTSHNFIHDDSAICPTDNCIDGSPSVTQSGNITLSGGDAGGSALPGELLPHVGASHRLDASGAWIPNRDPVDSRLIAQFQTNSGRIIDSENQVGGFPKIADGEPYADADKDGMPDEWETAHGLDPADPEDRNAQAKGLNGLTNLEAFLRGSSPESCQVAQPPTPEEMRMFCKGAALEGRPSLGALRLIPGPPRMSILTER
jgi:pectate lyase